MQTNAKRVAAVSLGVAIGGSIVGIVALFAAKPAPPEPARFLGFARVWARRAPPDGTCPGKLGELLRTSDELGIHHDPLVIADVGRQGDCVVASYSAGWAVTRVVTFFIDGADGSCVHIQAGVITDCGDFAGAVDRNASEVHVHDGKLCFDLSIDVLNGQPAHERWAGQLSLE